MVNTDGNRTIANGAGDELFSVIAERVYDAEKDALEIPAIEDFTRASKRSNYAYRLNLLVDESLDDGFTLDDVRTWLADAEERHDGS